MVKVRILLRTKNKIRDPILIRIITVHHVLTTYIIKRIPRQKVPNTQQSREVYLVNYKPCVHMDHSIRLISWQLSNKLKEKLLTMIVLLHKSRK